MVSTLLSTSVVLDSILIIKRREAIYKTTTFCIWKVVTQLNTNERPFIFERKLRTSGGTAAVSIPPNIVKNIGWKLGDDLILEVYLQTRMIIVRQKKKGK